MFRIEAPAVGGLAILRRPRANSWLEDNVAGWRAQGIDSVLCLLESEELAELGLKNEAGMCEGIGLEFGSFPIPDRGVPPSVEDAGRLACALAMQLQCGRNIGVHCLAGIGRSGLMTACVLVVLGVEPPAAFEAINKARGLLVPDTEEQREWVYTFHACMLPTQRRHPRD